MKSREAAIDYSTEEMLATYVKTLSHPVRVRILHFLASRACCFTGELTMEIPLAQSTISQHLKELKDAGLIQGDLMPPKVKYCINPSAWASAKKAFTSFFE